jgi:hypothetical protein
VSERISDERLAALIADVCSSSGLYSVAVNEELNECLRELQQRRNGQWICPGCGLLQEHPQEDAGF